MDPIIGWVITAGSIITAGGIITRLLARLLRSTDRMIAEWQGEPPGTDASGAETNAGRPGIPARMLSIEKSSTKTANLVADIDRQLSTQPGGVRSTLDYHERRLTGHDTELGELRAALRRNHPSDPATVRPDPIPEPPAS